MALVEILTIVAIAGGSAGAVGLYQSARRDERKSKDRTERCIKRTLHAARDVQHVLDTMDPNGRRP